MSWIDAVKRDRRTFQLRSVRKDPFSIRDFTQPSEEVMKAAVTENYRAIREIQNPSDDVITTAIDQNVHVLSMLPEQPDHIYDYAICRNPRAITYIKKPTLAMAVLAVGKMGNLIAYVPEDIITDQLQIQAVCNNPMAISKIKNPCNQAQIAAIAYDPTTIRHIEYPCVDAVKAAVFSFVSEPKRYKDFDVKSCKLAEDEWWTIARACPKAYMLMPLTQEQIHYCQICS